MATISEKLQLALDNKAKIKAAIEEKGGSVTDFASYADAVRNIKGGNGWTRGRARLVVESNLAELKSPLAYYIGQEHMGSIERLELVGLMGIECSPSNFYSVNDITIDTTTWNRYYNEFNYQNDRDFVKAIGLNSKKGNLRLEGTWNELPEDLLNAYIGWELYINGEHIGTITPKQNGNYY